ncbi:hypothetical protein P4T23_06365 [Bacillus spizizenii]|uniref:hypothetical protein n=1 Tax=Bacillus spizizenii TaxID=96241 RepID=UPI002E2502BB|nr:hypothetical protein [Bacillus spizizenii]
MIKAYTIGHEIPDKIKSCIDDWNYWTWITVANNSIANKDAKRLIELIEPETDKIAVYKAENDIDVFVGYMIPVR